MHVEYFQSESSEKRYNKNKDPVEEAFMRRKKKRVIKRIIRFVIIAGLLFALMKSGALASLVGRFPGIGEVLHSAYSSTAGVAEREVENLKKIYEEYVSEFGEEKNSLPEEAYPSEEIEVQSETTDGVTAAHGVVVTKRLEGLEIPSYISGHPVVQKLGYALSYNLEYVQPDWVAYTLDIEELNTKTVSRSDEFYEELDVIPASAKLSDYRGSGYDRGHLLSSADRTSSAELNESTFSLLNMSPQNHRYNAGLFLKAEDAERDAAREYGELYIVTGPVFSDGMDTIGESGIAVPECFYKVFLGEDSTGKWHAVGLILPQEYENGNLKPYFVTVDEVEKATGIDFYPSLPDSIENTVEAEYDLAYWPKSFR